MAAMFVTLRQPFAALDLPAWARMSDEELEALSDSDSEFSEAPTLADVEYLEDDDLEVESGCEADDFDASSLASTRPSRSASWADLLEEEEEQAFVVVEDCGSSASTSCSSPRFARGRTCWADLADSEDEEVAAQPRSRQRSVSWADLADAEDEDAENESNDVKFKALLALVDAPIRGRWADLLDDDDF